jgi:hypothetical protein
MRWSCFVKNTEPATMSAVHKRFLWFTGLNSASAGIATLGIFFLTKNAFGFSDLENFALGVLLGITYMIGAIFAGKAVRALERRFPSVTPKRIVFAIVILLAIDVALPAIFGPGERGRTAVWFSITGYSLLTGAFWPLVESYQTGGLRGAALRGMVARFNVTWSGANAVAMWLIAPYVEHHALEVLIGLGVVHLLSLPLLRGVPSRPGVHVDEHEPHPPVYDALLATHRVLLAAAYVVMYALTPYLPTLCARLAIAPEWQTPMTSIWMVVRVATFALLSYWQRWHGRFGTAVVGSALLLAGFGLAVLSPDMSGDSPTFGLAMLALGLTSFGVGIATLYNAALYYVLAVGSTDVDAGGTHEALIGVGYTVGPLCGIVAIGLENAGRIATSHREPATLALVAFAFFGATIIARRAARRERLRH